MSLDAEGQAIGEDAVRPPLTREEILGHLLSQTFRDEKEKLPSGSLERARYIFQATNLFIMDWEQNRSMESLEYAVKFGREALFELPPGHEEIQQYVDGYILVAQTKAILTKTTDASNEYAQAVQDVISVTGAGSQKDRLIQRLAWAHWATFEHSKKSEDLDTVIEEIEKCIQTVSTVLPETNLVLGMAYKLRFDFTNTISDLDQGIDIIEKELKNPQSGGPQRPLFLQRLVTFCFIKLNQSANLAGFDRLIANTKFALAELPESKERGSLEERLVKWQLARDELDQGRTWKQILDAVGDLGISPPGPKRIGKTHVPQEVYDAVAINPQQIRLLELLPGKGEEELACRLHVVDLNKEAGYEALSYTWGDPDKVAEILIDGHACMVTVNLSLALRRLRLPSKPRTMWVDAVCINQSNVDEKSKQVAIVGQVYENSSQVVAWLGEPSDPKSTAPDASASSVVDYKQTSIEWGTEDDIPRMKAFFLDEKTVDDWQVFGALSLLSLFSRNSHLDSLPFFKDPRYPDFNIGIYPSDLWQGCSKALYEILGSPYWSRVWILQELVLGEKIRIYYGRHLLPFEMFLEAERHLHKHYYGCCYQHCAAISNNQLSLLYGLVQGLLPIRRVNNMRQALQKGLGAKVSETLMSGIDFRKATDPRDHIYGVVGLLKEQNDDPLVRPDYELKVESVFARACFKIIRDSNDLQILSYADRQTSLDTLPSWCHDFGESAMFNPNPYDWRSFRACAKDEFNPALMSDSKLLLEGYHIDTVAYVTEVRPFESLTRASLSAWFHQVGKLGRKHCANDDGSYKWDNEMHFVEVLGRTILGDTVLCQDKSSRQATLEDIQLLYSWFLYIKKNINPHTKDWAAKELPEELTEIRSSFLDRTQSRKLFITQEGRIGSGIASVFGQAKEVLVGDEVFVLPGSNLPVVLRRLQQSETQSEVGQGDASTRNKGSTPTIGSSAKEGALSCALVSTAYVHGLMNGEADALDNAPMKIILGQYPLPTGRAAARNEVTKNALRTSFALGHGTTKHNTKETLWMQPYAQEPGPVSDGNEHAIDAEAFLFPDGREWDESFKPIPPHRVWLSKMFQNMPTTEEDWREYEDKIEESVRKNRT